MREKVRLMMSERGLEKTPGCSSVEVEAVVNFLFEINHAQISKRSMCA